MMIRKTCPQWRRVGPELAPISRKVRCVGSLRNPVGPLPSSIYWRRRAVALSLIALLAVLVLWAVTSGGGSGNKGAAPTRAPIPRIRSPRAPRARAPPSAPRRVAATSRAVRAAPAVPGWSSVGSGRGPAGAAPTDGGGSGGTGSGRRPAPTVSGAAAVSSGCGGGGGRRCGGQRVPAGLRIPRPALPGAAHLDAAQPQEQSYRPGREAEVSICAPRTTRGRPARSELGPKAAVVTVTSDLGNDRVWSGWSSAAPRTGASCSPGSGQQHHHAYGRVGPRVPSRCRGARRPGRGAGPGRQVPPGGGVPPGSP